MAGKVPASLRPICAPRRASGPCTRFIGRRLKEASPTSWLVKDWPAKIPIKRRVEVPELFI